MQTVLYIVISLLGGAVIPLQLAMVGAFRHSTQASQIQATFYLYCGGALAALLLSWVSGNGIRPPQPHNAQWWHWLTGFVGSLYILLMLIATPHIGAASTLLWVFLGQMFFAVLMAHFGWLGQDVRPVNPWKIAGLLLVLLGGLVMIWSEHRMDTPEPAPTAPASHSPPSPVP